MRVGIATTACAGVALAAAASGGSAAGKARPNNTIVLDRSIGGVRLKERRSTVERALGRGVVLRTTVDRSGPQPSRATLVAYRKRTLTVGYVSDAKHPGIVLLVETRSPLYRTRSGVGVGSRYARMMSLGGVNCYGGVECQHGYEAEGRPGTTFRLDAPRGTITFVGMTLGH
jgi:hypothetical protein